MRSEFQALVAREGHTAIVMLSGVVDRASRDALEIAYREAAELSDRVVLDFRDVEYINSTGIAVLVGFLALARADRRQVGAFGLSDHYREVFNITRLADFMTIYDDEISPAER